MALRSALSGGDECVAEESLDGDDVLFACVGLGGEPMAEGVEGPAWWEGSGGELGDPEVLRP